MHNCCKIFLSRNIDAERKIWKRKVALVRDLKTELGQLTKFGDGKVRDAGHALALRKLNQVFLVA